MFCYITNLHYFRLVSKIQIIQKNIKDKLGIYLLFHRTHQDRHKRVLGTLLQQMERLDLNRPNLRERGLAPPQMTAAPPESMALENHPAVGEHHQESWRDLKKR